MLRLRGQRQIGEVLVGQDHHLAAAEVVPLGDVVVADLLAADRAGPLVLDPPAVGAVHLVEPDVLLLGRRVELHPDGDQPERDRPFPDRPHRPAPSDQTSVQHRTSTRVRVDQLRGCELGWALCPGVPRPMLATTGELPVGPGWAYEFKWDGVRALAVVDGRADAAVRAFRRRDHQGLPGARRAWARPWPTPASPTPCSTARSCCWTRTAARRSSRLAERMHVRERRSGPAARGDHARDLHDLRRARGQRHGRRPRCPMWSVASCSSRSCPPLDDAGRWVVPPRFTDGQATLEAARELALEGVVAKRLSSTYRPGARSPDWIKIKHDQTGDYVVGGWRPGRRAAGRAAGRGARPGRAALPRPGRRRHLRQRGAGSARPAARPATRPTRRSPSRCRARTPAARSTSGRSSWSR